MKTIKYILFALLVGGLQAVFAQSETINKILVSSIESAAGKEVAVPINMTNTSEIVAVQFNLHLPFAKSSSNATIPNRSNGHTVSVRSLGSNVYTVIIVSMENKALAGNSGVLLNFPMKVDASAQANTTYDMTVSDVILTDKSGNNIATGSEAGTFIVQEVPTPDFIVKEVAFANNSALTPQGTVTVNWKVGNIGNEISGSGWTENIYLVDAATEERVYIGNARTSALLVNGSELSRSATLTIPDVLGIDDDVYVDVDLVSTTSTGELIADRANNSGRSTETVFLNKKLYLTSSATSIEEGATSPVRLKLVRTGNWSLEESFSLTGDESGLISLPATVTIPAGQSAVYFYVNSISNETVNAVTTEHIQVTAAHGYDAVSYALSIEDDEYLTLLLSLSKSQVTEGDTFQLKVKAERESAGADTVYLSCELPRRFSYPTQVVIPAGEKEATVTVTAVEDDVADLTYSVAFYASANYYNKGQVIQILNDNDMPDIALELSPTSVSEGAGLIAIMGKLTRATATNSKITVKLTDDSEGALYYSTKTIVLEKGVNAAEFSMGVVDNGEVDGNRTCVVKAAVYVSSCSCEVTGTNQGAVTETITILDDDGPSLKLTTQASMIQEGSATGTNLIVTRNTATTNALPVTIGTQDSYLEFEANVTIPAGQKSVSVPVKALQNGITGDTRTVVLNVTSDGFTQGTCWLLVSDKTLPDAQITQFTATSNSIVVCENVGVSLTVTNSGVIDLPTNTKIYVYAANTTTALDTLTTNQAITPGASLAITATVPMPDKTGSTSLYAVVNPEQTVAECLFINNTSDKYAITLLSPYTATVTVANAVYEAEASVLINGQVTGTKTNSAQVEVYVINEGKRQTIMTTTDSVGNFSAIFTPTAQQMGHFVVGACYPNEGLKTEQDAFDIFGLRRVNNSFVKCETLVGTAYEGAIILSNPGNLDLTNVSVEIISTPANCTAQFNSIALLKGGETASLQYSIMGSAASEGTDWEKIVIRVTSDEGASFTMTFYYYCRTPLGKLKSEVSTINTTMIKGSSRDYSFTITNMGQGPTGTISLLLPEGQTWMKSVTPVEMASLEPNGTASIILRLTPTDDMELNLPYTGRIALNCENGEGTLVSFRIEPVSGATGTLTIDACDEFTYYSESAPHLQGAEVVIKHPTSGALITQGITNDKGLFSVELPEGYYRVGVTADDHETYSGNILVDPGKETIKIINLSFQAIKVDWNVVETEVEDVYKIVTTVKYETNVPVPVVEVILPDSIPLEELEATGSYLINAVVTNKGLITANQVTVVLNEVEGIEVEYLMENIFDLAPATSVIVPIRLNIVEESGARGIKRRKGIIACTIDAVIDWMWYCGDDRKSANEQLGIKLAECFGVTGGYAGGGGGGGGYLGVPGGSGGSGGGTASSAKYTVVESKSDCDPCVNQIMKVLTKCLVKRIPIIDKILTIEEYVVCAQEVILDGNPTCLVQEIVTQNKWIEKIVGYKDIYDDCIKDLFIGCDGSSSSGGGGSGGSGGNSPSSVAARRQAKSVLPNEDDYPSYYVTYVKRLSNIDYLLQARLAETIEIYGDSCWLRANSDELSIMGQAFSEWRAGEISDSIFHATYKPSSITDEQMNAYIERMNNTYANNTSAENIIHVDSINVYQNIIKEVMNEVLASGCSSIAEYYAQAEEELAEGMEDSDNSVCASVTLQLSQTMTMTRQAFLGTLTVFNGHESKAMTDVKLTLEVTDENGDIATSHEFQIDPTGLTGFTGNLSLTEGWSLGANSEGVATIQFIPTKYAAPTVPVEYSFGGTLSYTNPYSGETVTRDLYPVTLTVKPSPNLNMTYFMQRDILGDNALTTDVVEPMVASEFSVLINNIGNGDATNVNIVTEQPKIIENEKGLLIDFELLSSQVNGAAQTFALGGSVPAELGTIPAHSTAYVQWWLQCSLLGHFVSYDIEATHVTSYGNEDLSLLNEVTIHELTRSLKFANELGDSIVGFLVNDITDSKDCPDVIYFSDATMSNVLALNEDLITVTKKSNVEFEIKVMPETANWYYGQIADPTNGNSELISVQRKSDGKRISLRNFWQTEYTLRDGREPVHEYRLHFADSISLAGDTYVLNFEPYPEKPLAVESFDGLDSVDVQTIPVQNVNVHFNKAIVATTFTTEDLKLICQGKSVDLSDVTLNSDDNKTFQLNLAPATSDDGYYVLTVQTAAITDTEGYSGRTGKTLDWIQFKDGILYITAAASPTDGGQVSETQRVAYDSLATVSASPASGYQFGGWYQSNTRVSDSANYTTSYQEHTHLTALFNLKNYNVTVDYPQGRGTVTGGGTGIYPHGTSLTLKAEPTSDYQFGGWVINGIVLLDYTDMSYTFEVTEETTVTILFSEETTIAGIKGDVNDDGRLDVNDISNTLNYLSEDDETGFNTRNADMNNDSRVDVTDITILINKIIIQ